MSAPAPFSRPIRVEAIPREGLEKRIEADEAERKALAAANRLPAIGKLVATFSLRRGGRGAIILRGEMSAEITQTCVVTLEPFDTSLDETVELKFAPLADKPPRRRGDDEEVETVMFGEEGAPDSIVDGKIDLGAVAAEFLTLNLDPYPRKPGAEFVAPADDGDARAASPFSALAEPKKSD
jgi:hypothetical protein